MEVNVRVGLRAGREGGMGVVLELDTGEMTSHKGEKEMETKTRSVREREPEWE